MSNGALLIKKFLVPGPLQTLNSKPWAAAEAEEALRAINAVSDNANGVAKLEPDDGGGGPLQEELHSFEIEASKVPVYFQGFWGCMSPVEQP